MKDEGMVKRCLKLEVVKKVNQEQKLEETFRNSPVYLEM